MRVKMIMQWKGVTPDQYEKLRKLVNWEGDRPKGGLFHVAAFDDKGIRVTDIWESAEEFNHFAETRLNPGVEKIGIKGEPLVEIYPVHAMYVPEPQALQLSEA